MARVNFVMLLVSCSWLSENGYGDLLDHENNLRLPLDVDGETGIMAFFGDCCQNGYYRNDAGKICTPEGDEIDSDQEEEYAQRTKAVTTVGSYRSALKDYFKSKKQKMSDRLETDLSTMLAGFRREYASMKQDGLKSVMEGRSAVTFEGYVALAQAMVQIRPTRQRGSWELMYFGWVFLIFCWNLLARSISVGNIMLLVSFKIHTQQQYLMLL